MTALAPLNVFLTSSRIWLLAALCLVALGVGQASLPITDRDEALFVQASRQMVEDNAWVDIRFQDQPRYKKPVGIYWLQSMAARISGMQDQAPLWVWRLPSLFGAIATTLMVGWLGHRLWGAMTGAVSALLFASLFVVAGEARIGTTDAVLMSLIVLCQIALVQLAGLLPSGRGSVWLFWLALGAAVLVKGPIAPMILAATILSWSVLQRDLSLLRALWQPWAVAACILIVLPWLVGITLISGGAFWKEAVVQDLLSKVASGQEGKGLPAGSYLLLLWISFWPASAVLPLSFAAIWRMRRDQRLQFLLCWLLASWIIFEMIPTKLFHYTMPLYPALVIMSVAAFLQATGRSGLLPRALSGLAVLVMAGVVTAVLLLQRQHAGGLDFTLLGAGLAAGLCGLAFWALWRDHRLVFLGALGLCGAVMNTALLLGLAHTPYLWPSTAAVQRAQAGAALRGCAAPSLVGWGFTEPSLVWLGGRDTLLLDQGQPLPAALETDPCTVIVAEGPQPPAGYLSLSTLKGFAIGAGRPVTLQLYQPEVPQ
ncbi:ArnT family glycosyltransferase [Cypionkella sp.]|uniref:ArnT family glycosyltransferase n=1 Tax=Cypionkella sp. TaxID=2811411 RepID=UPI003752A540